jgi:hypothetical protein
MLTGKGRNRRLYIAHRNGDSHVTYACVSREEIIMTTLGIRALLGLLLCCSLPLHAQVQRNLMKKSYAKDVTKVEFGFTATFLHGNQGAQLPMFSSRNDSTFVTGSNYVGAQSGVSARMNFEVGSMRQFIIPVGIDMTFMRGLQRLENPGLTGHGSVSTNITSIVTGCQYRFAELPLAEAFLYGGVDVRGSFIGGARFQYEVDQYSTGQPLPQYAQDTTLKPSVFRLGGALRVGVQGIISEPLRINISAAYGVYNLVGRDLRTTGSDRRGQLLTPTRIGETAEQFAAFSNISLWLQYYF